MRITRLAAALLILATAAAVRPAATQPIPGAPLTEHHSRDRLGRTVTWYASTPPRPAPILLLIQGSGCATVLRRGAGGAYSTLYDLLPLAAEGRFTVVAVEKPFASAASGGGTAQDCSPAFNAGFTAESWLAALRAALEDARKLPTADGGRTLVFGVSEGAVMADLLAGADPKVTDVVAVSGSGTSRLFDFVAGAYADCFDRSACLTEIERQVRAINADPLRADAFAWGHPYRRWSSFFRVDPGEALLKSRARVYLALGTADRSVPPLSGEVAAARLLAAGRDVTVRRVGGGDHMLGKPDEASLSGLEAEYRRALDWFWAGGGRGTR